jgi:hypothetical protein
MDDSFVSKTSIQVRRRLASASTSPLTSRPQNVDAGDTFHCTFGPDPAVRITYDRKSTTTEGAGGAFMERHNSSVYTTRIAVANKHKFAVEGVVVRDSIPTVSDVAEGRAKVLLVKPDGLAEAGAGAGAEVRVQHGRARWCEGGGDEEGKYEWLCDIEAGKEVSFESQFEVRAPADIRWKLV